MKYSDLVQVYFERSSALQSLWTIYILVIAGVIGFSTFRQKPEIITVVLVTILYACFAFKNLGSIEATAEEREAVRTAIKEYPTTDSNSTDLKRIRETLEHTLEPYDIAGVRLFHWVCDLMTIAVVWGKEWQRRKNQREAGTETT